MSRDTWSPEDWANYAAWSKALERRAAQLEQTAATPTSGGDEPGVPPALVALTTARRGRNQPLRGRGR